MANNRIDARQHRQILLDAAREVFLEHGITAPLAHVVARAGLGRATLYRHFPDRAALALAIASDFLDMLEKCAVGANGEAASLEMLYSDLVTLQATNPFLADLWRVVTPRAEESGELFDRFCTLFKAPIRQAVAGARCRPDLKPSDMMLIAAMLGTSMREPDIEQRRQMLERIQDLIIDGLRPRMSE